MNILLWPLTKKKWQKLHIAYSSQRVCNSKCITSQSDTFATQNEGCTHSYSSVS